MNPVMRLAGVITQIGAGVGATGYWVGHTRGLDVPLRALIDPHTMPDGDGRVGWIVIGIAVIGALCAIGGSKLFFSLACVAELAVVADFITFEALRRAPGRSYNMSDIGWGLWMILAAVALGIVVTATSRD